MPFYRAEYIDDKKEMEFRKQLLRTPTPQEVEQLRQKIADLENKKHERNQ